MNCERSARRSPVFPPRFSTLLCRLYGGSSGDVRGKLELIIDNWHLSRAFNSKNKHNNGKYIQKWFFSGTFIEIITYISCLYSVVYRHKGILGTILIINSYIRARIDKVYIKKVEKVPWPLQLADLLYFVSVFFSQKFLEKCSACTFLKKVDCFRSVLCLVPKICWPG